MKQFFLTVFILSTTLFNLAAAGTIPLEEVGERICSYTNSGHVPHCLDNFLKRNWEGKNALEIIAGGCRFSVNIGRENCFKGMIGDKNLIYASTQERLFKYLDYRVDSSGKVRTKCDYVSYNEEENCLMNSIKSYVELAKLFSYKLELADIIL